jgi:hypothetical protein
VRRHHHANPYKTPVGSEINCTQPEHKARKFGFAGWRRELARGWKD